MRPSWSPSRARRCRAGRPSSRRHGPKWRRRSDARSVCSPPRGRRSRSPRPLVALLAARGADRPLQALRSHGAGARAGGARRATAPIGGTSKRPSSSSRSRVASGSSSPRRRSSATGRTSSTRCREDTLRASSFPWRGRRGDRSACSARLAGEVHRRVPAAPPGRRLALAGGPGDGARAVRRRRGDPDSRQRAGHHRSPARPRRRFAASAPGC